MTAPLLSMRGVRKAFGPVEVLRGVDFDLRAGEVHALIGHNGAGKSTLMKVLGGLFHDYTGTVAVDGVELTLHTPLQALNAGIATIHQEFALVPSMNVAENIALGREPRRARGLVDHRRIRTDAVELLQSFGWQLPMDRPVGELSVSTQQLAEIAKALSRRSRILVMDEPTARLSAAERESLFSVLRQLAASGTGIIYISHFLDEVLRVADRVTVLREGAVAAAGNSAELDVATLTGYLLGHPPAAATDKQADTVGGGPVALQLAGFGPLGGAGSDLTLHAGEVLGLAGLVGSGRTRLAEAICGAQPAAGTLLLHGQQRRFRDPVQAAAAGVVLVPEDRKQRGLVLTGTITDNIMLGGMSRQLARSGVIRPAARRAAAKKIMDQFRVRAAGPDQVVGELSGGNQQKVLLARAAAGGGRVLVLDQPTAGVDVAAKQDIYASIRALVADGAACLVISDELDELLELGHRIAIVRDGQVVAERPRAEFGKSELLAAISVGEGVDAAWSASSA